MRFNWFFVVLGILSLIQGICFTFALIVINGRVERWVKLAWFALAVDSFAFALLCKALYDGWDTLAIRWAVVVSSTLATLFGSVLSTFMLWRANSKLT